MGEAHEEMLRHYEPGGLLPRIVAGLQALGKDLDSVTHEDLAQAERVSLRGTFGHARALVELAKIPPGSRVLDVGSGLGGPARYLAATLGCDVTGIDLSPEFCGVANALSRMTRLSDRTRFQAGDALELPFAASSFDVVWTIQMQMNIRDKRRLYSGIARVLRPRRAVRLPGNLRGERRADRASGPMGEPPPTRAIWPMRNPSAG